MERQDHFDESGKWVGSSYPSSSGVTNHFDEIGRLAVTSYPTNSGYSLSRSTAAETWDLNKHIPCGVVAVLTLAVTLLGWRFGKGSWPGLWVATGPLLSIAIVSTVATAVLISRRDKYGPAVRFAAGWWVAFIVAATVLPWLASQI